MSCDKSEVRDVLRYDGRAEFPRRSGDQHIVKERPLIESRAIRRAFSGCPIHASDELPGAPRRSSQSSPGAKRLDECTAQCSLPIQSLRSNEELGSNDGAENKAGPRTTMKPVQGRAKR